LADARSKFELHTLRAQEGALLVAHYPTILTEESHHYAPEDLEAMRQVFMRACGENPQVSQTEEQREVLAKAVLNNYQRHLTQTQMVAAALRSAK
jgi:hypothetical protein